MKIQFSFRYAFTFLLLTIVMMELHELVHICTGRMICGCWGPRDFNVWELCKGCEQAFPTVSWWATFVGPAFSFALMWLGAWWLKSAGPSDSWKVPVGFSFIFANIPFGRITTVMMGGGDEMVVIRHFLKGNGWTRWEMIALGSAIVLMLGVPPFWRAYKTIHNRHAWLIIVGFMTLPLVVLLFYTLGLLNGMLTSGILSDPWILGTPALILIHTFLAGMLLVITRRNLLSLVASA